MSTIYIITTIVSVAVSIIMTNTQSYTFISTCKINIT